ncbi:hypothetical protein [Sharpea azabuensis]|uniref:hypothetical protein n=1 Tax=Sharpea azabuensis TaxID=322505 RepID=UPI0023F44419|nr:hypothetical protein [Sharpea azabuensis]
MSERYVQDQEAIHFIFDHFQEEMMQPIDDSIKTVKALKRKAISSIFFQISIKSVITKDINNILISFHSLMVSLYQVVFMNLSQINQSI